MKPRDSVAVAGGSASRPAAMKRSPPPGRTEAFLGVVHCGSPNIPCFDLRKRLLFPWISSWFCLLHDQVGQIETKNINGAHNDSR